MDSETTNSSRASSPSPIHPRQYHQQQSLSNRHGQGTLASVLKQAPPPFPEVHHAPIAGMAYLPTSAPSASPTVSSPSSTPFSPISTFNPVLAYQAKSSRENSNDALITTPVKDGSTYPTPSPPGQSNSILSPVEPVHAQPSRISLNSGIGNPSPHQDLYVVGHHRLVSPNDVITTPTTALPEVPTTRTIATTVIPSSVPFTPIHNMSFIPGPEAFQSPVLSTFPAAGPRNSISIRNDTEYTTPNTPVHRQTPSRVGSAFPKPVSFPHQQHRDGIMHNNPYKAPSGTNSCAFIPPKVPGYDFKQGSQAGNMGLMMGKRISDGMPVSGLLHQSRLLLQHEHRILKRLQIMDGRYDPKIPPPSQSTIHSAVESDPGTGAEKAGAAGVKVENEKKGDKREQAKSSCYRTLGDKQAAYETGLVEDEKHFNRVVEDFIDLDQDHMSILILRRLGPNLLSRYHHRYMGLDETDGHQSPEVHKVREIGTSFPDVYTFLVFCLKAACALEALQRANIAHLALCPTSFHWSPPDSEVTAPGPENAAKDQEQAQRVHHRNPSSLYHDPDSTIRSSNESFGQPQESLRPNSPNWNSASQQQRNSPALDVNRTKLRLFDFTHSKILSHERARAPNNIFEWQVPGYLEYHLQYLAPEQTGRAETWMDHRTDIYGLGATLFSLLTNQFPNQGVDSVQILQGVLSRRLPPLQVFRPDMPLIIDSILQKMTQKQPSQRYQSAFGFKQDILRCLSELRRHGTIEPFPLGDRDISYQFVLPNAVFGRHVEQQMISAAISQAASAYQNSLNSDMSDAFLEDQEDVALRMAALNDSDHYVFEDDIVSLQSHTNTKIPLSSKTLLRTPKPFNASKSVNRGSETTDPIVRAIFVSGPSGVGKTILIRGMATVARNSGLFAGGAFEIEGSEPYSAILSCIRSVLQQLLTQHTDALASLVVAMRTAFEPDSGIGIICDLVPELKYFFSVSEMPESKDVPLTHSVARFHALILKLIRVISTHFFMTWLIDDIHYADDNSIALLATLVNVNKRLPMVLIMTHSDTVDCLIKVKQILGGSNVLGNNHTGSYGSFGGIHHDSLVDEISNVNASSSSQSSMSKATAIRATGLPLAVRGGGGVRFIRLQNPTTETIQEFLGVLLHRDRADCAPLAKVLYQKSWLTIRQLVLELYRNQTIHFNCVNRIWEWESCQETLAQVVRRLTGEEYAFLENRFRALDCNTKKTLVCAAICGSVFTVRDLQHLASTAYVWSGNLGNEQNLSATTSKEQKPVMSPEQEKTAAVPEQWEPTTDPADSNKDYSAMAGLQSALREGILVYTSSQDNLRFNHSIMRKVALNLLEASDEKERLHYEMTKIMIKTPGQEFRTASHVLQCLQLIKKKATPGAQKENPKPYWVPAVDEDDEQHAEPDIQALRSILSRAGEKSQKSGAQDMAMAFWSAALSLLPENCWDPPTEVEDGSNTESGSADVDMESGKDPSYTVYKKTSLYREALKMHLQCIEAERWREQFDRAMKMCDMVLSKIADPVDRARVYQHQIEMSVWAYSQTAQATRIAIQCLQELGMPKDITFEPTQAEIRELYDRTHQMLLIHMEELQAENPRTCHEPRIMMMTEVLSIANASLYYANIPFLAVGVAYSIKLVCDYGITAHAGRAMASFALTHSTWHGCLENAYELGLLACRVSKDNHHVKFLFHLTVQQWGDHIANSIPALEETLTATDMTCDRLFHTAGMIHVSVMRVLLGRTHLRDCMTSAMDLITKHVEFGPKSHGVEVMYGIAQLIKCLRGQTHASNPETIFDDNEFAESKLHSREKVLVMVHNSSTYTMLKIVAAFVFGHYGFINEVTDTWHDDPKSMMNFEGSWIAHSIFTVVGLAQVNLLRTEQDPEIRKKLSSRLFAIRDRMEQRAKQFPTNHAAMFHLLEAEIADQEPDESKQDLKKVLLLYEKAIAIATEGNFPLHQTFSYELAAKCHLRHGLSTSARCLLVNSCKGYQEWGAKGKVQWLYRTYPEMLGSPDEIENVVPSRGLFYRPSDIDCHLAGHPQGPNGTGGSNVSSTVTGSATSGHVTSPWSTGSPKIIYSPSGYGNDAVSAAAAAIAKSCMATNIQGGSVSSASSTSGPLYNLQNNWAPSPGSPEADNADLDVLDFSSVIEAMQVVASEIDLDLLLVKSLGVLNQSVGAKRCCVVIYKDQELLLAASQGDLGRCEAVNPPMEIGKCSDLFHGVINYVVNTSAPCLLTNAKDDPRFCADEYLKQRTDVKTVMCAPILHKAALVGVLYMEEFPERAFANMRMLVMNLLVQQLGISITNALLYQSVLQSETKLNGLLENMPCGIALWDATADNCQYINSSWRDMTGYSIEEIMESGWHILTHEDETAIYFEHWRERVLAGVPCQWESRYKLKDGSYRWAIVRMLPIMSPTDNKIIQWLTVTIDIDDQRRAVQLKSNFLANMSHELRTPFSGILGMLSLLRDSSGLSNEQFEFVDMAKASCEMLIRIVDDLLNFSKLEADKVTLEYIPLVFEEIIGDVCDLLVPLASRKGLELIILIDDTLPLLLIGDPDRVKQILMNLIGNAIKFSSTGSVVIEFWHEINKRETLTRAAKNNRPSQNLLKVHSNKGCGTTNGGMKGIEGSTASLLAKKDDLDDSKLGDEVVLHCSVKDQGIGLSPEEQKMLFVSFQQTDNGTTRKYGGTGLGLSICAQIIAHMHGNIKVDSEKGQGATFTFTAKLRTRTAYDVEQSPAETERIMECERILTKRMDAIKGRRMLILSPNRMLREQIRRIFKNVVCLEFDDVKSALESGVIRMTELCSMDGPEMSVEVDTIEQHDSMDGDTMERHDSMDGDTMEQQDHIIQGKDNALRPEDMMRFDFILVDHVLDSEELDRIYPSPIVAFILLLAPTTETLRWILPPAIKRPQELEEPPESGQIDIGGRGRIFKSSDIDFARQELRGQVQRVSHETSAQQNNAALASIAGGAAAAATAAKYQPTEHKGANLQGRKPSELFKKRKSRRHITVTRPMPSSSSYIDASVKNGTCDDGGSNIHQDCQNRKPQRMETTTFQACRLIKPVRRMKLLQIIYNAIAHHLKYQAGDLDETSTVDLDSNGVLSALSGEDEDTTPRSSMSPTSSPSITADASTISATSKKRRREHESPDSGCDQDHERGSFKSSRPLPPSKIPSTSSSSGSDETASRNLKRNRVAVGGNNIPKRGRNNDALTLLLSSEERQSCRGKNVLVAEDDFVSQKILEKQLSKLGMNVMIADNGQEAVNQWLSAGQGHYTIAIFDHHMPIMDGLAATKKLRALEAEMAQDQTEEGKAPIRIPIVGLSADIQQTTKESCIKAGMDEYMTKPLLTKGLALLIQRYCCN